MTRADVVKEAKSWIGTPYHPCARQKGVGIDCGMLLAEVYHNVGLAPDIAIKHYSPEAHMHQIEDGYTGLVQEYATRVERDPLPGDLILYRFGKRVGHAAIVIEWPLAVHALVEQGVVYEDLSQKSWTSRQVAIYSIWGD